MNNNTINITPAPSALGAFMPTGSYQKNCKNITITLLCNCTQEDGADNPTVISFAATDAAQIYDIVNENGSLGLSKGMVNPKPFAGFGPFIPAGSYQNTSSKITVVIEAQCLDNNNKYMPSMLQFKHSELDSIIDIANTNGVLTLVNNYDTISTQVNACFTANTAALNTVCKNAIIAEKLDPLTNYFWEYQPTYPIVIPPIINRQGFISITGLGAIDLTNVTIDINSHTKSLYSGSISVVATFGNISGVIPPLEGAFPQSDLTINVDGYKIMLQGSVSIQLNATTFSVTALNLGSASASFLSALPSGNNTPFSQPLPDDYGNYLQTIKEGFTASTFTSFERNAGSVVQQLTAAVNTAFTKVCMD